MELDLALGDALDVRLHAPFDLFHIGERRFELGAGLPRPGFGWLDSGDGGNQGRGDEGGGQNHCEADPAVVGSIQESHDAFLQVRSPGHFEAGDGESGAVHRRAGDAQ